MRRALEIIADNRDAILWGAFEVYLGTGILLWTLLIIEKVGS